MSKKTEKAIDMARYVNSEPIDDRCAGCENSFFYVASEGEFTEEKCRIYPIPSAMWPRDDVKYLEHDVTIRKRNDQGKAVGLEEKRIPIVNKICPMATHKKQPEIVTTSSKSRAGQQKQAKK